MGNPDSYSSTVLTEPDGLVRYCNFSAVGTFNANGTGEWVGEAHEEWPKDGWGRCRVWHGE